MNDGQMSEIDAILVSAGFSDDDSDRLVKINPWNAFTIQK
jgi:hypothetical protein